MVKMPRIEMVANVSSNNSGIATLSRKDIVNSANPAGIEGKRFSPHEHLLKIDNPFLGMFLQKHERSECPALFVIWSAISAVGALMQKRAYFALGSQRIYPNQFVCFVGSPGSRKSTGISFARILATLGDAKMRFAPTDTSGRKQGLMHGFLPPRTRKENSANKLKSEESKKRLSQMADEILKYSNIPAMSDEPIAEQKIITNADDVMEDTEAAKKSVNSMYACASELGSLTGISQLETFIFLSELWDAPDVYVYSLRDSKVVIYNPLFNLIAGVTPETLRLLMPAEAVGQGVMSRFIFVHGSPERKVARPLSWSEDFTLEVQNTMLAARQIYGEFGETMEASNALDNIYQSYSPIITDIRLMGYVERRHTHLIKICMCLAAMRGSNTIGLDDVIDANYILELTEYYMPEAIGQTGSAKVSICGNLITYALAAKPDGLIQHELYSMLRGDYTYEEVANALTYLRSNDYIFEKEVPRKNGNGKDTIYILDRTRCTVRSRDEIRRISLGEK